MPKKRAELRYDARPLLNAIQRSQAETIPLFTEHLGVPSYWPKLVVVLSPPGRLRLPARDLESKVTYRETHSGKWDNRTSPGRCVLNGKWETVDPSDPDYPDLSALNYEQRRYRGVTTRGGTLKVYTYQIDTDLDHAKRQQAHVLENYDLERQRRTNQLSQAQERFAQARTGVLELPAAERGRLIDEILTNHNRLTDIRQIYDERLLRAAALVERIIISAAQLHELAESVRSLGLRIVDPSNFRPGQLEPELQRLEDKISFFQTADMEGRTRQAGMFIHQVRNGMDGSIEPPEAARRLISAAKLTEEASIILTDLGKKEEKTEV